MLPASALFEASLEIVDGPAAGTYPSEEQYWTLPVWSYPGGVQGPTVFGGYACSTDGIPAAESIPHAAGDEVILVVQRGPSEDPNASGAACTTGVKAATAIERGYDAFISVEHHEGAAAGMDAFTCRPPGAQRAFNIAGVCVGHRAMHLLFDRTPDATRPYPLGDPADLEPEIGELGRTVRLTSPGNPILAAGQRIGSGGWTSFAVSTPGGTVSFPLRIDGERSPSEIGAWVYDANGAFAGGTAFGVYRSEISTHDTVTAGDTTLTISQTVTSERQGMSGMTANVTTSGPTRFKLLVWGIGRDVASWQWAMRGGPGVELHGTRSGTRAWYYSGRDLDSPLNLEVNGSSAVARATLPGTKTIDIEETFIGGLSLMGEQAAYVRTLRYPDASEERICQDNVFAPQDGSFTPCTFTQYEGSRRAGPGRYTFSIRGAGASYGPGGGDVKLWAVDSTMPPFPN